MAAPLAVFHNGKQVSEEFTCLGSAFRCAIDMGVCRRKDEGDTIVWNFTEGYIIAPVDGIEPAGSA